MNFIEAFNELNALNEDTLTEKMWVAIQPKGSDTWYKFYTVENKSPDMHAQKIDIANMLGDRNGTYKQTLDREVLALLRKELEVAMINEKTDIISDPNNYTLKLESEVDPAKVKTLTLTDRALRQEAQKEYDKNILKKSTELQKLMQNKKCLIHHVNGSEEETTPQNVVLVPYIENNKTELKVANGIHSILHVTAAKHNIKKSPINWSTPIYYFNKAGQLQIGSCEIVIDLSRAPKDYTNEN